MQMLVKIAGIFVALAAFAPPAEACKKRHETPFELFDTAASVAIGTVGALPPELPRVTGRPGPGDARLDVTRNLRGAGKTLTFRISDTDCLVNVKLGERILIFVSADGWPAGGYEGVIRSGDIAAWERTLDAWAAAKDNAARASVLADAIASGNDKIAVEAAAFLVDEPALLAALDAAGRKRIASAKIASTDWSYGWVLVRLRDPRAVRVVPAWAHLAQAIATITTWEAETDTSKLAAAIETGTPASRMAAFERCERVLGARLWRFSHYIEDLETPKTAAGWHTLAESCRAAKPVP